MASAFTHAIVGASLAYGCAGLPSLRGAVRPTGLMLSAAVVANLPDLDIAYFRRVAYSDFLGHRGFWHAPAALVVIGVGLAFCAWALIPGLRFRGFAALALLWSAAGVSHSALDAMTDGGLGVMLLYPLDRERYFLPWRPIRVSPIGLRGFWRSAAEVLASEVLFCVAAAWLGVLLSWWFKKRARSLSR
jgi:inner membrane protein